MTLTDKNVNKASKPERLPYTRCPSGEAFGLPLFTTMLMSLGRLGRFMLTAIKYSQGINILLIRSASSKRFFVMVVVLVLGSGFLYELIKTCLLVGILATLLLDAAAHKSSSECHRIIQIYIETTRTSTDYLVYDWDKIIVKELRAALIVSTQSRVQINAVVNTILVDF
jgi:hypothetical protein